MHMMDHIVGVWTRWMRPLWLWVLAGVLLVGIAPARAQVSSPVATGTQVEGMVEFKWTRAIFGDLTTQIPLPPGQWTVARAQSVMSSGSRSLQGFELWMYQASGDRIHALVWMQVYPNAGISWEVGRRCLGELMRRDRGAGLSGYCHSLRMSDFMSNPQSTSQSAVRSVWAAAGLKKPDFAVFMDGFYERRGGFTVYADYALTSDAIGMSDQRIRELAKSETATSRWQRAVNSGAVQQISRLQRMYEDYSARVAAAVVDGQASTAYVGVQDSVLPVLRDVVSMLYGSDNDPAAVMLASGPATVDSSLFEPVKEPPGAQPVADETDEQEAQQRQAQQLAEQEKLAAQERDKQRLESEAKEKERLAAEAREKERVAAEAKEKERLAAQAREKERLAAESRERDRLAAEVRERDRLAAEGRERERLAAVAREREQAEQAKREAAERERLAADLEAARKRQKELEDRLAAERQEREKLLAAATLAAQQAQASKQRGRVALVIGNAAYKDSPLANPVNDATDMAQALREVGFEVILRTNVGRSQMRAAVREFGESLRRKEVGVFYFAGHGIESRGKNFLIPLSANVNAEYELEDEAVDANSILRAMEDAGNPTNIMILDACRDNPFARGWRSASRGLAQMNAPVGSFIAFATAPGSVAADGTGRNGVFTKHLLTSLRQQDLDIDRVFTRVTAGVAQETAKKQVPWKSSSLTGAFSF